MLMVVSAAAIGGFSVYLKRRAKSLESDNQKQFAAALPYRSLFEPTGEEIRAFEREEIAANQGKTSENARLLTAKKLEKVEECRKIWRVSPDKRTTVKLLRLASESEMAQTFSAIAEDIIKVWRENRIVNLTADNLADLLDSHLRTLPQQERTAGALFWLKREIMSLRAGSE